MDYRKRAKRQLKTDQVYGSGRYALLSRCGGRKNRTAYLYHSEGEAFDRLASLDETGCCGSCIPILHEVHDLERH